MLSSKVEALKLSWDEVAPEVFISPADVVTGGKFSDASEVLVGIDAGAVICARSEADVSVVAATWTSQSLLNGESSFVFVNAALFMEEVRPMA
jgi:hypothetical protein